MRTFSLTLNRTILELKQNNYQIGFREDFTLNRTILELKLKIGTERSSLANKPLIVPYWN
uniref:hypothetical protein n=1 Tax=Saccharicrinis fermentans TaxID=982 RepID=UPI00138B14FD